MDWQEKLEILCDVYAARGWDEGLGALNEAERVLFCVPPFQAEMTGGGFWAFFHNATGDFVPETITALRGIGAEKSASLLSEAVRIYFRDHPVPRDVNERRLLLKEIDGNHTAAADHLNRAYGDADEPLDDLLLAYARANERHLRLTEDEAATVTPLDGDWRQCPRCSDAWEAPRDDALARCPACQTLTLLRDAP